MTESNVCHHGDALEVLRTLPDECAQTCVTSPPYWGLRDYGVAGQLGLEATPEEYVAKMVSVFAEVRRVLRMDGTLWLNLGDSYANAGAMAPDGGVRPSGKPRSDEAWSSARSAPYRMRPPGLKPKDLVGIPWRVAFALQADGWYLRSDIVWSKPNPMPESVTDRPTRAHEYVFLLSRSERYYYDADAIRQTPQQDKVAQRGQGNMRSSDLKTYGLSSGVGRSNPSVSHPNGANVRSVWTIASQPYPEAHFAVFPEALVEPCVLAGSKPGDVVLDPFLGSGTTAQVAQRLERRWIGIELNAEYLALQARRTAQGALALEAET